MKINLSFKQFKKNHKQKKNQILFRTRSCRDYNKVENLFRFLLTNKNSFIFESVEKGKIRGRYTIIGLNPDKVWDINKNIIKINSSGKIKKIKTNPLVYLNKLIKNFKVSAASVNRYAHDPNNWENSRWIVPLGSSGNPGSKHYFDQLELWANGETIPQLWNWDKIKQNCETRQKLISKRVM